jgi:hypothetical protein
MREVGKGEVATTDALARGPFLGCGLSLAFFQ